MGDNFIKEFECHECGKTKTMSVWMSYEAWPYKEDIKYKKRYFCTYTCLCRFRRKMAEEAKSKEKIEELHIKKEDNKFRAMMGRLSMVKKTDTEKDKRRKETKKLAYRICRLRRKGGFTFTEIAKQVDKSLCYARRLYQEFEASYIADIEGGGVDGDTQETLR